MKLPKELITVTPLSKCLALLLFVTLPILGFLLGIQYEEFIQINQQLPIRYQLLKSANYALSGQHCGGNMTTSKKCISGTHCAPSQNSHLPFGDVGGICVLDSITSEQSPTFSPAKNIH